MREKRGEKGIGRGEARAKGKDLAEKLKEEGVWGGRRG